MLIIDIDSQANSSKVLLPHYPQLQKQHTIFTTILDRNTLPIHKTHVPTLDIVPSHILLSNADVELTTAIDHREERLKRELDLVKHNYDYMLSIAHTLSWITINTMTASDKAIVIVYPGYFELDSIVQISNTIKEVKGYFNPNIELSGFIFTMSGPTVNSKTSLQIPRQTYTGTVFTTVIPRNTDIRDAHFEKKDIFLFRSRRSHS